MGFRFRKSVNLGGGAKLNLSKKSIGLSIGTKNARVSVNSNGRRTTSASIPGTGISYVSTKQSGGGKYATYTPPTGNHPSLPPSPPEPPREPRPPERKWYWSTWFIAISLFFCFPIGLYLMWRRSRWHIVVKCIISVVFLLAWFDVLSDTTPKSTDTAASSSISSSSKASASSKPKTSSSSRSEKSSNAVAVSEKPSSQKASSKSESSEPVSSSKAASTATASSTPQIEVAPPVAIAPASGSSVPAVSNSLAESSEAFDVNLKEASTAVTAPEAVAGETRTAYWTPSGKSYHLSSECSTLSRSKNIQSGTLQQALDGGHTDPCDKCAGG